MSGKRAASERSDRIPAHIGAPTGTCFYCGEPAGPSSSMCPACGFNPGRRERELKARQA